MAEEKAVSRQLAYQRRKKAEGRCASCGNRKLKHSDSSCGPCLLRRRKCAREKMGHSAWTPGAAGRKPIRVKGGGG